MKKSVEGFRNKVELSESRTERPIDKNKEKSIRGGDQGPDLFPKNLYTTI